MVIDWGYTEMQILSCTSLRQLQCNVFRELYPIKFNVSRSDATMQRISD